MNRVIGILVLVLLLYGAMAVVTILPRGRSVPESA